MKKILSVFISALIIVTSICCNFSAYASEMIVSADNFNASFDKAQGTLVINGQDAMYFCTAKSFQDAFSEAQGLSINDVKKVVVNEGVTVIDRYAFENMMKLEEVTLPESLVKINGNAFKNCRKIKTINYGGSADDWNQVSISTIGNSFFLKAAVNYSVDVDDSEGDFRQSYTVMKHGKNVYDFNTAVLTINDTGAIQDARIDQAWFGMGDEVAYQPICVEGLVVSEGVTRLESDVMASCESLEYVKIPSSVTAIQKGCFYGCDSLSDVYYEGSKEDWKKVKIDKEENDDLLEAKMHYSIEKKGNPLVILGAIIVLVLYSCIMVLIVAKKRKKN